jgi:hypothetical protein
MSQTPFVIQPRLTSIALTYRNEKMIADQVLPRVPVESQTFKYSQFTQADAFTVPDTKVGPKSAVNEIDWTATEASASTQDYALEDLIPGYDVQAAQAAQLAQGVMPIDPQARSTELITSLLELDRETRAAGLVFNAATYPAANKSTLAGVTQWSDYTNSNPVTAILTAMDGMLVRPNSLVLGQAVWTILRQHPKVVQAILGNTNNAGVVNQQQVADLLEIDNLLIGKGWSNSAKRGQTPTMARLWGKFASLLYIDPNASSAKGAITFGITGQWGTRIAGTIENDPSIGMRGGTRVRVGEAVKELVLASDAGYLFSSAVA